MELPTNRTHSSNPLSLLRTSRGSDRGGVRAHPPRFTSAPCSRGACRGLLFWSLVAVVLLCPGARALAGSFNVKPVRIFLDGSHRTGALYIRNESANALSLQLNAVEWTQDREAKDRDRPTDELVFFPRLFTIEKGKKRMIRVGLVKPEAGRRERTFRIYIRELPISSEGKNTQVRVLLRVGVPVFLAPVEERVGGVIEGLKVEECRVVFAVKNTGTVNLRLQKVSVYAYDEAGKQLHLGDIKGWYLLAGVSRRFSIDIPTDVCRRVRKVSIRAGSDKITIDGDARVPAGAARIP